MTQKISFKKACKILNTDIGREYKIEKNLLAGYTYIRGQTLRFY